MAVDGGGKVTAGAQEDNKERSKRERRVRV